MKRFSQLGVWFSLLLLATALTLPAAARGGAGKNPRPPNKNNVKPPSNSGNQKKPPANEGKNKNPNPPNGNAAPKGNQPGNGNGRGGMNLPPKFVEKLQDMSPDQQEKFMKNNERFRNMTPEEQARIRQNLQHWNSLTSEQRNTIRLQEAAFEKMSPQDQQFVRQQVRPTWNAMSPAERKPVLQHLRQLYGMSTPEAEAKLNDLGFLQGLTPEQQRIFPFLYHLRVGASPEPPQGPPESL
jgi:predicted Fe-S protein YdhL (DUF1289 family)